MRYGQFRYPMGHRAISPGHRYCFHRNHAASVYTLKHDPTLNLTLIIFPLVSLVFCDIAAISQRYPRDIVIVSIWNHTLSEYDITFISFTMSRGYRTDVPVTSLLLFPPCEFGDFAISRRYPNDMYVGHVCPQEGMEPDREGILSITIPKCPGNCVQYGKNMEIKSLSIHGYP